MKQLRELSLNEIEAMSGDNLTIVLQESLPDYSEDRLLSVIRNLNQRITAMEKLVIK